MYATICGSIGTGKTTTVQKLADLWRNKFAIEVRGFSQPSIYVNGERQGYKLYVYGDKESNDTEMQLAHFDSNSKGKPIPFKFNDECFEKTFLSANKFENNGKRKIIIIDELAQLEILKGKGHRAAIDKWIQNALHSKNLTLLFVYNPIYREQALSLMNNSKLQSINMELCLPTDDASVENFANDLYHRIISNSN